MVEALRDYLPDVCGNKETCYVAIRNTKNYKNASSVRSANPQFKEYDYETWKDIIDVFAMRVSCLFGLADTPEYERYTEIVTPYEIHSLEEMEVQKERVFVISAFPEFLIDYYGRKLWKFCYIVADDPEWHSVVSTAQFYSNFIRSTKPEQTYTCIASLCIFHFAISTRVSPVNR